MMNHSIGISDSYYRATERELLDDHLKAADSLTVNSEEKLKSEVKKLECHVSHIKTVELQLGVKANEIQLMKETHEKELKAMREEMENKFQQLLTKIDLAKIA
jgi:hypothetical protein